MRLIIKNETDGRVLHSEIVENAEDGKVELILNESKFNDYTKLICPENEVVLYIKSKEK
jgi:hypothetical protein